MLVIDLDSVRFTASSPDTDAICAMLRPVSSGRVTARVILSLAAAILVIAVVAGPLADVIMFGIHDHVAAAQTKSTLATVGDAQGSHHCELWMSAGDIAPATDPPAAAPTVFLAPRPALSLVLAYPLPSFPPPRA